MTLSSRRKHPTTARTIRPSTELIKVQNGNCSSDSLKVAWRSFFARLGGWASSTLLLAALPLTSVIAQDPQANSQAQNGAVAAATWIPPVHVAPRRVEVALPATNAVNLSDQYPGVFDPDPNFDSSAQNEIYQASRSPVGSRHEMAQVVASQRGQGRSPARSAATGTRLGNSKTAPNQPAQPNRPLNRQVTYQQAVDQSTVSADSSPQSEVQPAFVADGDTRRGLSNSVPQRAATRSQNSRRSEFTGTNAPGVRDAGLNAEFAELEQPLESFAQTPMEQAQDASVLDNGPALPNPQRADSTGRIPSRPASMPRNFPSADSPELSGGSREWNPNLPPPTGVMSQPDSIPDSIDPDALQDIDSLPRPQKTLSCDELRDKLLSEPLRDIALDVSPQLPERGDLPSKPSGDWIDHNGNLLARGQMVALSRGYVIVDTAEGRRKISVARLGDASLAMVASAWQLPGECAIGKGEFSGRCWTPQLSTWHASNLCHKPLYFENVQLERYGHSAGPIMGPLRSSAHFFGSLAFWPYHTAINPPNECIYSLGHYRPGNCAPWLVEPFPFSARGAIRQGAFVTGAAFLF